MLANVCFPEYKEKKDCEPNKEWKEKGCKKCRCSLDGKRVKCTTPAQCYKIKDEKKDCKINETKWDYGCKKCSCTPDGKAIECAYECNDKDTVAASRPS